jgi:toxin ParE1/3/4
MSAPKRTVELSPDAEQNYDDILLYSVLNWGETQMQIYQVALDRAIETLAEFPEAGARRDRLFPGCRIRPVEHHVIYYPIKPVAVEVVRILHERADAARHLRP